MVLYIPVIVGIASKSAAIVSIFSGILLIYSLAILVPSIAVTIRQLHDIGKEWYYIFISLIPIVGAIWLIILMIQDGTPGSNEYGPNPKEVYSDY